jgi:hypothetical protein
MAASSSCRNASPTSRSRTSSPPSPAASCMQRQTSESPRATRPSERGLRPGGRTYRLAARRAAGRSRPARPPAGAGPQSCLVKPHRPDAFMSPDDHGEKRPVRGGDGRCRW